MLPCSTLRSLRHYHQCVIESMDDKGAAIKTDNSRSRGTESERTQGDAVFELGSHAAKDNAQFSMTDSQSVGDIARKEAPKHCDDPSME
ncbi:uncharacterized protein LOC130815459 isoform X2 [Amaranthus tricolor]|nr:uncharacterized protein LOC130815459 isoform X2 [Amaranthus tricolor]